jgi:RND superfamily putative drug exporter
MNARRSASLVRISTIVHPKSQEIVPFIDYVRAELENLNGGISAHLFGAYSSDYDVQNALYALTPYLYASTIVIVLLIVGASFQSVAIALRLAITIIMSLAWTYGLMTMVYQPGVTQTAFAVIGPSLKHSTGVYWIIPIMSFSILVGLALDYDIFLMSRVLEFRREGWSDRAAICLAIEKTGGIITAAGVIMAVSFAGLLFPDTMALNQYGFSLCIGVTLDTFVVRTLLVPAVFTAFGSHPTVNWWPGKMNPPLLDDKAEEQALLAGYWHPPEKWPLAS